MLAPDNRFPDRCEYVRKAPGENHPLRRRRQRRKNWQIVEGEIYFSNRAVRAHIPDAQRESGIELRRIDQTKKCAFGIDAGDDRLDGNFIAVREHHAANRAVFYANVLHVRAGANLRACFTRRSASAA